MDGFFYAFGIIRRDKLLLDFLPIFPYITTLFQFWILLCLLASFCYTIYCLSAS
jgi:hypothetical protein